MPFGHLSYPGPFENRDVDEDILSAIVCTGEAEPLEKHCREASVIVEQFAGGWFSKASFQGKLTPASAQAFADYALKKMRDELRVRRASDG